MSAGSSEALSASGASHWIDLQEAAILERGGVQADYANNPGKLRCANAWVGAAKPALLALLKLEDLVSNVDDQSRRLDLPKHIAANYSEAMQAISTGATTIRSIIDGIRDDFISDERAGAYDDAAAQEEADAFSNWLNDTTFSFDDAIQIVRAQVSL